MDIVAAADGALGALRGLPPSAATAREMRRLRREALLGSATVAGVPLTATELDALVDRGLVAGVRPLAAVLLVRDLAAAAAEIAGVRPYPPGDPRPLLTIEDMRRLHRTAAREHPEAGAWRTATIPPREGVVAPPPWLIVFEATGLVERMRRRPERGTARWIAGFLARAARLRAFPVANGRVARLAVDLVLARLGLPPLVIAPRDAQRYRDALTAATAGERAALEAFVARALADAAGRLAAAASADDGLVPLRDLAGAAYPALAKAARRGTLRTVARGARLYTTRAWIAQYRTSRWRRDVR